MLETRIGMYLKAARQKAELTQEQAAKLAGMSRQQVNRIEKGESGTEWDTVEKLVAAYRCDKAEAVRVFTDVHDSKPDMRLARQLEPYLMKIRPDRRQSAERMLIEQARQLSEMLTA